MNEAGSGAKQVSGAPAPGRSRWIEELRGIAWMILAVLAVWSFVAKPFYIPSESMMPTLIKGDRLVVTKYPYGWSYASAAFHILPIMQGRLFGRLPSRGDVVTLDRDGEDLIKRVIGLPGDRIAVKEGVIILNGVPVKRVQETPAMIPIDANLPCATGHEQGFRTVGADGNLYCALPRFRETLPSGVSYDTIDMGYFPSEFDDCPEVTVPPGQVFVMGDNRDESADSRVPPQYNGLGGPIPIETISGRADFITHSYDGNGALWNPISWFTALRNGRAGTSLHPQRNGQ
ncbi:MAG TPA: signal peptidase I [Sphingomonas sp.]|uniref:signal peptidase I n=1 Tax=Sphingomonas sp. TaxID=28214 RepID=UPI002CC5C9D5|nr:signal peptidase I [Sphingomonas sp.]HMI18519.1 signal peptidase I [Sphingomonas sp.]